MQNNITSTNAKHHNHNTYKQYDHDNVFNKKDAISIAINHLLMATYLTSFTNDILIEGSVPFVVQTAVISSSRIPLQQA